MRNKPTTRRSYSQHGKTKTPEYNMWKTMLQRCYNTKHYQYHIYGGKGITVCDAWRTSFESYLADIGPRPTPKHSLHRIESDKGYMPGNCEWRVGHGRTHTPEYNSWANIRQRCNNPDNSAYADYGERGIALCQRWQESFEAFYADMGPRPTPQHSVERLDNSHGYEPDNCVWATMHTQTRNKRNNIMMTYNGITQCLADWSRDTGYPRTTLLNRKRLGWSDEEALTIPPSFSNKLHNKDNAQYSLL